MGGDCQCIPFLFGKCTYISYCALGVINFCVVVVRIVVCHRVCACLSSMDIIYHAIAYEP